MSNIIFPKAGEDPMDLLHRCGGYYRSPADSSGKFIGPLVGYAGKYKLENANPVEWQYVGFEYANFAAIEKHGPARSWVAEYLIHRLGFVLTGRNIRIANLQGMAGIDGFVGAPEGGKALADTMSTLSWSKYIFPDKNVTQAKTDSQREVSRLVWGRHTPEKGEKWVLVEDVCNNFSTTASLIKLIESTGAEVSAIACFLNRTIKPEYKQFFPLEDGRNIPIIARVTKEIPEYQQLDPEVFHLVSQNKVFWKPKDHWDELMVAMNNPQKV